MSSKMMEEILSEENLQKAYHQVMRNKGASGVDRMEVTDLAGYLKENGEVMTDKIRNRKYKPLPVRRVQIPKGDGSKRDLGIPSVKDRWLQQAVYQVISPCFEEIFVENSYGFRPQKSCEKAVMKALEYMNDGYDWLVDIDLSKFFDTVNQDILMILVHQVIKDPDTESLIRKFLQSGVIVNGMFETTPIGTPQGGNLSPLLANVYLHQLDEELEKRGLRFTRYADDILIYVKSVMAANRVMESITRWLKEKLRVEVNMTKTKVARPPEIKYLGFGFYKKIGTKEYRPKPHLKSVQKFMMRLKQLTKRSWSISMEQRIQMINPVIRGWINYFRICDMKGVMARVGSQLRVRIRMCIWKQWKTIWKRVRSLVILGLPRWRAESLANSRKGYMAMARGGLTVALSNAILKKKGLLFPEDHYLKVHL